MNKNNKYIVKILFVVIGLLFATQVSSKTRDKTRVKKEHSFSVMDVKGKYKFPLDTDAIIEGEKIIKDIIIPEVNFSNRILSEYERV